MDVVRFKRSEEILIDREVAALRVMLLLRFVYVSITMVSTIFIGKSLWEKFVTGSISTAILLETPIFLWLLARRRSLATVGYLGLFTDILFLNALPFVWYQSVGGEAVLPAYMVKHPNTMVFALLLIIGHGLAGRTLYPALMTLGAVLQYAIVFGYAALDPRTVFSSDFVSHITGPTISLEFMISCVGTMCAAGALLTWNANRVSRSLRRAVSQEVQAMLLSRYFSPGVQDELLRQAEDPLGGNARRQNIVALFTDLRGFTALSESAAPEEVASWLREYHQRMVAIVFQHGGVLDKFLGDGMLATFGAPRPQGDETRRAARAALAMRDALPELNASRAARGLPLLRQGVGLHFGPAIVGNVGVPERLEYTVLGDTVNVASRLQSLCKDLGRDLLLSGEVFSELEPALQSRFEMLGAQNLRGRDGSVIVYAARDP
ncbi:MAG: adenylate/guanylate cyclase domain-containing protein [Leptospirales bacterium]|nr:adenylate/guanylate cyclase domain-containing protein [Leptospirales bacterium]